MRWFEGNTLQYVVMCIMVRKHGHLMVKCVFDYVQAVTTLNCYLHSILQAIEAYLSQLP